MIWAKPKAFHFSVENQSQQKVRNLMLMLPDSLFFTLQKCVKLQEPYISCLCVCVCVCGCVCPDIEFKQGDKEHVVEVEVLFDGVREMREAFTLHLKPDENMVAETQVRKCAHAKPSHDTNRVAKSHPF